MEKTEKAQNWNRRNFVRAGAFTAAGVGAALSSTTAQSQPPANTIPNLYPNWNASLFTDIMDDENAHVPAIIQIIQGLGGTPRPKPNLQNLAQPNIRAFASVSQALENTGSGAYTGAAPVIFTRSVLAAAASIALIEARHSGYLNVLFDESMTTNVLGMDQSFETALTQQQVINLASPFIKDLNGGPPLAFSSTPSRNNDIAILNFALALEYLEMSYYNLNVPVFFPKA